MVKKLDVEVLGEGEDLLDEEVMGDGCPNDPDEELVNQVLGEFPRDANFDRKRTDANIELIQLVAQFLTDYPSMRFGQALSSLNLVTDDVALVEPQMQLERAKAALKKMGR